MLPFLGIVLVLVSLVLKNKVNIGISNVQVLETPAASFSQIRDSKEQIAVDISGSVKKPGLYYLPYGSRVEDLLSKAGGLADDVNQNWIDKNLNRAAKLVDGQKIYVPFQQSDGSSAGILRKEINVAQYDIEPTGKKVNINTASSKDLDDLPGIGQVYAQKIIDNRPYSDVNDLTKKEILKESTFSKIKDLITVY